jgi:hypothetical protein
MNIELFETQLKALKERNVKKHSDLVRRYHAKEISGADFDKEYQEIWGEEKALENVSRIYINAKNG